VRNVIMKRPIFKIYFITIAFIIVSCRNASNENTKQNKAIVPTNSYAPQVSADEVLAKVQKQVYFGKRVPGTPAHKACGDWIFQEMEVLGLNVQNQEFSAVTYNGNPFTGRNIIASFNPQATKRILLSAHWDSRAFGDQDDERQTEPIDAANDAGSGVAVLIQIAQAIAGDSVKPEFGIDYVFFDAEDMGPPASFEGQPQNEYSGFCLGSDYWSKNPHVENYTAFYGILFDMVGAKGAKFKKEGVSMQTAPNVQANIWNTAASLGYSSFFVNEKGSEITDDHWPIIRNRKIPMVDIIDLQAGPNNGTFFNGWHTHDDNMDALDAATLKAVTQTALQVLYNESAK
jgi:glutaminyl-peptide cyclotransferase